MGSSDKQRERSPSIPSAKTIEFPVMATFCPGLSVTLVDLLYLRLLKAPSFHAFCVVICTKIRHRFVYLALAVISFSLLLIL